MSKRSGLGTAAVQSPEIALYLWGRIWLAGLIALAPLSERHPGPVRTAVLSTSRLSAASCPQPEHWLGRPVARSGRHVTGSGHDGSRQRAARAGGAELPGQA